MEVCIQVASKFVEYTGNRDATSVIGVEGRRFWYKMGKNGDIHDYSKLFCCKRREITVVDYYYCLLLMSSGDC